MTYTKCKIVTDSEYSQIIKKAAEKREQRLKSAAETSENAERADIDERHTQTHDRRTSTNSSNEPPTRPTSRMSRTTN